MNEETTTILEPDARRVSLGSSSSGRAAQRPSAAPGPSSPLSTREAEVLQEHAWGATRKQIARRLGISTETVKEYENRIKDKLHAVSGPHAVAVAIRHGWIH